MKCPRCERLREEYLHWIGNGCLPRIFCDSCRETIERWRDGYDLEIVMEQHGCHADVESIADDTIRGTMTDE